MTVTVRFAPSPTGFLHVGNARQAVVNWLFARKNNGTFILRIDDTDAARSKQEYVDAIERDLTWLGLAWQQKEFQSARMDRYTAAADKLKGDGRLYPCFETAEELDYKRKLLLKSGQPPIYRRAANQPTAADTARYENEGRRAHWRFELRPDDIAWDDLVRGPSHHQGAHLSDPVLIREDGTFLYMLPSCVDDIDMNVTHVIRGEDHVTNTALQIQIMQALGGSALPAFGHMPLLVDPEGKGLSKRMGSLSLSDLRGEGIEPMAITSLLAKLGSSDAIEARTSLEALVADFEMAHFGRATPKFDPKDLEFLNAKVLHDMPYGMARPRLVALGIAETVLETQGEAFWTAVRGNLRKFDEALGWWNICFNAHAPSIEDTTFMAEALALLPAEPWDHDTWHAWTEKVKEATGRKGKGLYLPLRMALTGLPHGPELKLLLPLIGRARAEKRLAGVTA